MILRLPRHVAIGAAAAVVGAYTVPHEHGILVGCVSACLWLAFSLCLRKPRPQQWLILGFLSPFLGAPLTLGTFALLRDHSLSLGLAAESALFGMLAALLAFWYTIPIGLGMGLVAALLSRVFSRLESSAGDEPAP